MAKKKKQKKQKKYKKFEVLLCEHDDGDVFETYAKDTKEANIIAKQVADEKDMYVDYVEEINE